MMDQVSLAQMLEAREARVRRQQELLTAFNAPLLSFTMNIAGPIKTSPLIRRGFEMGLLALEEKIDPQEILHREVTHPHTGSTAFWAVDLPPEKLKEICLSIEEATPLGRLFDMDVLTQDGAKLERKTLRGCIVCGAPGRDCAARRLHSVEELQTATKKILTDYFKNADALRWADLAVQSLLEEVQTTPKPGLVDGQNNGSHQDMDLPLFEKSAQALRPYFEECFRIGAKKRPREETFQALRKAGLEAEKAMLTATNGVNTHKGAIFTLGLLLGSLGQIYQAENEFYAAETLCREAGSLYAPTLQKDLKGTPKTAGLKLYQACGIQGVRGEAAEGFPTLRNLALPTYESYRKEGLSPNHAGACTLLHLIAKTEDTNLYHRGGKEGARWAKTAATELLKKSPAPTFEEIENLDEAFIQRNLSPGGSADLLAATYFLSHIQE